VYFCKIKFQPDNFSTMKKIALIVQRYGLEVNGGAEYHCRILAEKLNPLYDVEVLTSCAKDYISWANEYPGGLTEINGVKVRRFPVAHERNKMKARFYDRKLRKRSIWQKVLRFVGLLEVVENVLNLDGDTEENARGWAENQGPYVPDLIDYLQNKQRNYNAFIFFTYLYYPAIYGLRVAPQKSILIPTAHDEPPIYMTLFKSFFKLPRAILYNTRAEKNFVNRLFKNEDIYSAIAGVGIDTIVPEKQFKPADIIQSDAPYLIYIGRIDVAKGCEMMFRYFLKYKKSVHNNVKLVLIGKAFMDIPVSKDIISLGFVSEDIKQSVLKEAKALIIPSFYESLSLVTLESMAEGIPVIANERCEVLKDHIDSSKAGFTFANFISFKSALDTLFNQDTHLDELKSNAKKYVNDNYRWETVLEEFRKAIDFVSKE